MTTTWEPHDLELLSRTQSLILTAGDGGDGVEIGMAVTGGQLYVRAYRGPRSAWYQAALAHGRGRVTVAGTTHDVVLDTGGLGPAGPVDEAFTAKYGPAAAGLVASADARAATIRICPAPPRPTVPPAAPANAVPAHRAVENLLARYAELVDDGDFAGVGELLADASFTGSGATFTGREAIEGMFRDTLIVYADGTPRTQHVTSNVAVDVDEDAGTAEARSCVTVLQAVDGLPLQVIAAGRYRDRFTRRDGRWRFTRRQVDIRLVGDVSRHLRAAAAR
ncbi:DUF2255 family protein [Actinacidiphila rubida]|uniref:SnoaL-like domain-containing protein n=1 Tax=Actinacidiphila rubida TaxID=310780 RepID=A0A1H8R8Z8_9ACTN|nr:DUF2255 family protein [Actinacidiphila rubida]SEO62628.1 hypothetical protein SAMN05216267_103345 [Actinacidiphila rubida]